MVREIGVRLVRREEEPRFQQQLQQHHYLGGLRKIGETVWYVATYMDEWVALLTFSAAALKLAARDRWIGWSYRQQHTRLNLLANNTRFCVLPGWNHKNVGSRTLALCERRLSQDWSAAYGHPILLLETFVDSSHHGTVYRASNWMHVGETRGFRRISGGYSARTEEPKKIFLRPLDWQARARLCQASIDPREDGGKRVLKAEHLRELREIFRDVPDPRLAASSNHSVGVVLAIAAGAHLCGIRGYRAMGSWAQRLTQGTRARLRCRYERNHYRVPSASIIRSVLNRVDKQHLESALQTWNVKFAVSDASLRLEGHALLSAAGLLETAT
jgi:hypothetical protein